MENQPPLDLFGLNSSNGAAHPRPPEAKCYKHERVTFSTLPTYFPAICSSSSSSSRPVIAGAAALLLTTAAVAWRRLPGCLGDLFLWPCVGCLFIILSLNNLKSLITKNETSITGTKWKTRLIRFEELLQNFFLSQANGSNKTTTFPVSSPSVWNLRFQKLLQD